MKIGLCFLLIYLLQQVAVASPAALTYQGRIVKADGTPLEYSNVSFVFQIMDPAGTCLIYQEQVIGYNMINSGGVFDVPIGTGVVQYPIGGASSVLDAFNNSHLFSCGSCVLSGGTYTCADGSNTYEASSNDNRKLRVQFYDGNGWQVISPDNVIRSVPFAGYSLSAQKLGDNVADDFLLKAGIPHCGTSEFLTWNGTALSCVSVSGASGGTVTSVNSSNAYLTVANTTAAPVLTINVGQSANTVAAGNDPRIVNALQSGATAGGDLSGTLPAPAVIKIQGVGVNSTTPTAGDFMKYVGGLWTPAALATSDVSGLDLALGGKISASQISGSCAANQTLVFLSPTSTWACTNISLNDSQIIYASQIAHKFLASPATGSGTPTFRGITASDLPSETLAGAGAVGYIPYYSDVSSLANSLIFQTSGNVGIGTTTPGSVLEVKGAESSFLLARTSTQKIMDSPLTGAASEFFGGDLHLVRSQDTDTVHWDTAVRLFSYSDTRDTNISLRRARGTKTTPAYLQTGDLIGSIDMNAINIVSSAAGASWGGTNIASYAEEDHSATSGAAYLRFATTGLGKTTLSERMRITATGNVGIGTTSPGASFVVQKTATAGTIISSGTAVTGSGTNFTTAFSVGDQLVASDQVKTITAITDATHLTVDSAFTSDLSTSTFYSRVGMLFNAGNVGIGTAATSAKLAVNAGYPQPTLVNLNYPTNSWNSTAWGSAFRFIQTSMVGDGVAGQKTFGVGAFGVGIGYAPPGYNSKDALYINGNVGIGTTAPVVSLDLGAKTDAIRLPAGTTAQEPATAALGMMRFNTDNTAVEIYNGSAWLSLASGSSANSLTGVSTINGGSGGLSISAGGTNQNLTLVGAGTGAVTSPSVVTVTNSTASSAATNGALVVSGGVGVSGNLNVGGAIATTSLMTPLIYGGANPSDSLTLDSTASTTKGSIVLAPSGGKVGIGTTNPAAKLHIVDSSGNQMIYDTASSASNTSAAILGRRSRGTTAAPAQTLSGDRLFSLTGTGMTDAGTWASPGSNPVAIQMWATEGYTSTGNGSAITFETTANGATSRSVRLRIDSTGNVGIGNSNPTYPLHVTGALNNASTVPFNGGFYDSATSAQDVGGGLALGGNYNSTGSTAVFGGVRGAKENSTDNDFSGYLALHTRTGGSGYVAERMRITSTGNVGVGTTAPSTKLSISANASSAVSGAYGGRLLHIIGADNANSGIQIDSYGTGISYRPTISFRQSEGTGGAPSASQLDDTLGSLGFWGYGATGFSANQRAEIHAAAAENWTDTAQGTYLSFNTTAVGNSTTTERLRISSIGNVGIGTANPSQKLEVSGNILASGTITQSSDVRLKRNIASIDNSLNKILNLRGVTYDWRREEFPEKNFSDKHQLGVIAQEVEKQFPEAVTTNSDGYKAVNYSALVAPVINAIKELYAKLLGQDERLASQARQIASLEDKIAQKSDDVKVRDLENRLEKSEKENAELKAHLEKLEQSLHPR